MKIRQIGEIGLIKRIAKRAKTDKSVVQGIGDDTAVMHWTKDRYLLFTCDMLVEDTHFMRKSATPFQIGWKAMCRNISDIAAMGGVPKYALVSASLDPELSVKFADEVYRGIEAAARRFGVSVVGGDTSRSKKIVIDISLIGEVEKKNLLLRSGAKPGDVILVTGCIGGSIKGKHLDFIPRLDTARMLVKSFKISSMIDISDGLLLDLGRILAASKVGARINEGLIPVSDKAGSFEKAIRDGEDFELLFTMSVNEARRFFRTRMLRMKTAVSMIGEIVSRKSGYKLVKEDGREESVRAEGYLHF